ncbi:hypothetical protein ACFL2D_03210 [Patescibacteria group bacterium]
MGDDKVRNRVASQVFLSANSIYDEMSVWYAFFKDSDSSELTETVNQWLQGKPEVIILEQDHRVEVSGGLAYQCVMITYIAKEPKPTIPSGR